MDTSSREPQPQVCSTLLMSRPARESSFLSGTLSALLHGALIGGALLLTSSVHGAADAPDDLISFLPVPPTDEPPPPPPDASRAPAPPVTDVPFGHQRLTMPTVIPIDIPPLTAGPVTDIRDFSGRGIENGSGSGKTGTTVTADDIDKAVIFTPHTLKPELKNRAAAARALERAYPPTLRDAGVGGTVVLWVLIDEQGKVLQTRVEKPSAFEAFDQAALKVGATLQFTPAMNRDTRVKVWIQFPIVFVVR